MDISKKKLVNWLKTQRNKKTKAGKIGYTIHVLGICFMSETDMEYVRRAYLNYLYKKNAKMKRNKSSELSTPTGLSTPKVGQSNS